MSLLACLMLLAAQTPVESDPTFFPFVIPWDDAKHGTATDVSSLNSVPAGKNGPIVAKNGHFIEKTSGKAVRFLATNLTTRAAFPPHDEADRIAAHLAKYGVNLVRFHHLQNSWDVNGGMIWKQGKTYLEIDPAQLDRLDYLIAALKKQGIYSNLNLQTSRNYLPEMGFPESVLKLTDYAKRIDKVDPKMITLQKQYAKELLDRTNRYTGNRYADEPALMVVEINNENSLVDAPWESIDGLLKLPEPFRGEIVERWNAWLSKKYSTQAALVSAWSGGNADHRSMLPAQAKWNWENQGSTQAQFEAGERGALELPPFEVKVSQVDGTDWHIQAHVDGLSLISGQDYTMRFEARSDAERAFTVGGNIDQPDWHGIGLFGSGKAGPEWKQYSFAFSASNCEAGHCRVGFTVGNEVGNLQVRNFQLVKGNVGGGLRKGEALSKANIDLPEGGSKQQHIDFVDFLADQEKAYGTEMRRFLNEDLGIRTNMIDSQVAWGGLTSLVREDTSSFADNHSYYNHPNFPGAAWSETNWVVRNSSMVDEMDKFTVFRDLAVTRFADKPYSISEFNEPAPNDHQSEMMPLLASIASVQDWDCLYSFDYGSYGAGQQNDQIQGFFAVGSNPAKKAFYPAAAMLFRMGLIPRAMSTQVLEVPAKSWERFSNAGAAWEAAGGVPDLFKNAIAIRSGQDLGIKAAMNSGDPGMETLKLVKGDGSAMVVGNSQGAKIAVGSIGGKTVKFLDGTVSVQKFGNGFGSMVISACDGHPLVKATRILITAMGRAENQGMGWNKDRTSVGNQWGHGPVMCEGIPAVIRLKLDRAMTVYALDPSGDRKEKLSATFANGELTFEINPSHKTVWYELSRS